MNKLVDVMMSQSYEATPLQVLEMQEEHRSEEEASEEDIFPTYILWYSYVQDIIKVKHSKPKTQEEAEKKRQQR